MGKRIKRLLLLISFLVCFLIFGVLSVYAEDTPVADPTGKKGVIVETWATKNQPYTQDPIELGIDHVFMNLNLACVLSTNNQGEAYTYRGKTYYFNRAVPMNAL